MQKSLTPPPRWLPLLALMLSACASQAPVPPPAPPQPTLQELLQQSDNAVAQGNRELARNRNTEATKAYPASKQPWLRLAEGYFEAADYGNAILAAQETLQRDPQDQIAHSILAVSGLRVSAASLAQLRAQRSTMPTNTRDEAEGLVRTLREALGESLQPARLAETPRQTPAAAAAAAAAAPAAAATSAPPAKAGRPTARTPPAKAAKPVTKPTNPFDAAPR